MAESLCKRLCKSLDVPSFDLNGINLAIDDAIFPEIALGQECRKSDCSICLESLESLCGTVFGGLVGAFVNIAWSDYVVQTKDLRNFDLDCEFNDDGELELNVSEGTACKKSKRKRGRELEDAAERSGGGSERFLALDLDEVQNVNSGGRRQSKGSDERQFTLSPEQHSGLAADHQSAVQSPASTASS